MGLYYEDGVLIDILGAGRYKMPLPRRGRHFLLFHRRRRARSSL